MTRPIGGFSLEGRFFIVQVPEEWNEMDPLPAVSPDDQWFDDVSEFKRALHGPWIRMPVRRTPWTSFEPAIPAAPTGPTYRVEEYRLEPSAPPTPPMRARSRSLGDLMESDGGHREVAARLGQQ
jgi:hypothetical protein